jgi:uncharacterized membrane protein YgcG
MLMESTGRDGENRKADLMKTQTMFLGVATVIASLIWSNQASAAVEATAPQAVPTTTAMEPGYPSGVAEVMKLIKGGVPTDIVLNYINSSTLTFYLSADNIIALQQQGVPKEVLTALLKRQGETQRQMVVNSPQQVPVPQSPAPAYYNAPPENPADNFNNALQARAAESYSYAAAPAPAYPVYYPSYYDYPYYPYAYGYGPGLYLGFGGYGYGHFGGGFARGGFGGFGGHGVALGGHGGGGFGGGHGGGGHR